MTTRSAQITRISFYFSMLAIAALAGCGGGGGSSTSHDATTQSASTSGVTGQGGGGSTSQNPPAPPPAPAPVPTVATTFYFSDCQSGAAAGCVPGNNANVGTSASAPKQNLSGLDVNALAAGSQLLFIRGGAWTNFNVQLRNLNATPASPLVFDAYGTGPAPWLKAGGSFYAFQFGSHNDTVNDGGYAIRNLKLDGLGAADAWGVHLRYNVHDVTLENLEITGFVLGIHSQSSDSGTIGNTALVIRNSNIHHNSGMGMLGDAIDMVIEGNTFANNNFSGSALNHGIYLGGHGRNGIVRNNTFTNNSASNGVCTGGNFTVHGQWDGLLVEGNTVTQTAAGGGCYGISINGGYNLAEYFRHLIVRGNTVVNVGGCGICLTSAPGAVVENNVIVNTQPTYLAGILIPANPLDGGDDADGGAIIRNNTIYLSQAATGSEGISLRTNSGSNIQVVSNLVYYGAASSSVHSCFAHGSLSNFTSFSNNLCHHASGAGQWSVLYATLALARLAGFDANSFSTDPLFVALPSAANNWNAQLQAGSPAVNTGNATLSSSTDQLGVARVTPDIGAREQ